MLPGPALADHVGAEDGGEPAFDAALRSHAALPSAARGIIGPFTCFVSGDPMTTRVSDPYAGTMA